MSSSTSRQSLPLPSLAAIQAELARRELTAERERVAREVDAIRLRCKKLSNFVREAWSILHPSTPYVHGWLIDVICDHLEAVTRGEINRLIINVPPGTMKTLLVSVFWPAWEWTQFPHLQYLCSSFDQDVVEEATGKMYQVVSSDWYQQVWGDKVRITRASSDRMYNAARGWRRCRPFVSLTGGRGDRVVIDDPHSVNAAESETIRNKIIFNFRESITSRLNDPKRSAIVIIMQRLHQGDVSGVALQLAQGYVHLYLPMEFEADRRCITYVQGKEFFRDPRTEDGELLFPERFPRETLDRDKRAMTPYAVAGQYQQRPAPREGGIFKRHWFERVAAVPANALRARGWDLAASVNQSSAWTVGLKMALADGVFYIEDVRRERLEATQRDKMILAAAKDDGDGCWQDLPQDPSQAGKSQVVQLATMLSGFTFSFSTEKGEKQDRATPVASQAGAGNIKIVLRPDGTDPLWLETFLDEVCTFPASNYKDQVDALSRAFTRLLILQMQDPKVVVPFVYSGPRALSQ